VRRKGVMHARVWLDYAATVRSRTCGISRLRAARICFAVSVSTVRVLPSRFPESRPSALSDGAADWPGLRWHRPVERAVMRLGLRNVQERFSNCLRKLEFRKPLGGVKVVFTALIDYPNIPIFGSVLVWDHAVNLVQFQRRWVASIFHAHSEMRRCCFLSLHNVSPGNICV